MRAKHETDQVTMSDETVAQNDNATAETEKPGAGASASGEAKAEAGAGAGTDKADPAGGEAAAQPSVEAQFDELAQKNAELNDRLLRLAAEMENQRKRSEREIADTRTYAIAGFARDMLTATDSLSRALMMLPAEARDSADGALKSLIDGIELTEREMQRLLAKHGVKPIEAEGEKFDPHKHQAMFEVPDPSRPEGTVVQVVQAGYSIGERILRPAMVGVAKGGPKPGQAEPAQEGVDKSV
jgi:molecular chaperone GrpE